MRHRKNEYGIKGTPSHRKAMLMNLTHALVTHKKIKTTLPKARAARRYAEKLITFARRDDVSARRHVLRKLHDRDIVKILFQEIGPKYRDRNGGYTRIIKLDNRNGDNAPMAILELVGFAADEPAKPKKRRSGAKKSSGRKGEAKPAAKAKQEAEEAVAEEQVTAAPADAPDAAQQAPEAGDTVQEPAEAVPADAEEKPAQADIAEDAVAEPVAGEAETAETVPSEPEEAESPEAKEGEGEEEEGEEEK